MNYHKKKYVALGIYHGFPDSLVIYDKYFSPSSWMINCAIQVTTLAKIYYLLYLSEPKVALSAIFIFATPHRFFCVLTRSSYFDML